MSIQENYQFYTEKMQEFINNEFNDEYDESNEYKITFLLNMLNMITDDTELSVDHIKNSIDNVIVYINTVFNHPDSKNLSLDEKGRMIMALMEYHMDEQLENDILEMKFEDNSSDEECIICFEKQNKIFITKCCNKYLCEDCVKSCMKELFDCPHCRQPNWITEKK